MTSTPRVTCTTKVWRYLGDILKGMISTLGAPLPKRSTYHSSGYDFFSPGTFEIFPGEVTVIDSGIRFTGDIDMRKRWTFLLMPRSSLGTRYGMRLLNTTGNVDQDYRGNIIAHVTADKYFVIKEGDRFMQGVKVIWDTFEDEEEPTEERKGGHGSTGA